MPDISQLLNALDASDPPDLADPAERAAGGRPFFVMELVFYNDSADL
jgi:aminoglycoside phosphotransferase (APT) family kinase protein